MNVYSTDLEARYGRWAVKQLASAYEAVLLSTSLGCWRDLPDRATRTAIVRAMLSEGEVSGFSPERMTEAGLFAAATASSPEWGQSIFPAGPTLNVITD